ncbi:LysR family transcriptional regulator [Rhodoferax sediminis]|jgi:DNA-binding transcriptional LysR family regulator|uniref:LysR family transcriptional regulator n=1 Tax=Rhodoferax sediminis TaxID=2509614 RepID=A0A515DCB7_9BURK|nr:LysR family transcriptional regulator [Rhodoferax sediminis]QDL38064.1 LysR family transcriptional regulator [Rhodoferax sediminis]
MNFRQLDLNLLRVLAAIHRTGSVTMAGKALSLSQPATSNALARLRDFFEDELFVRAPSGLKPTRLCEKLAPAVLAQLLALETVVSGHDDFEPALSDMHWRLSLSDLGEIVFLPALASTLRSQAPSARLSNISVAAADVAAALEAREIDLAIGILQPRHRGIRTELLLREQYVAMAAPLWRPASGRSGRILTMRQLAEAAFVVASPTATFHGSVEQMLVRMKLEDRIVLRARHFGALPDLALSTDLLSIVPEMYAHNLRQRYDFRVWGIPGAPTYDVHLVWHSSTNNDPAQQWMRALVHKLFKRPTQTD